MVVDTATGGLLGWIQTYGGYIQFVVQVVCWIVLAVAALWATLLFRRLVNFRTASAAGADRGEAPTADPMAAAAPKSSAEAGVSVDEFVD